MTAQPRGLRLALTATVRHDITVTFAAQLILLSASLVNSIVTARALGVAGRGQLTLALLASAMLILVFGLGSTVANVYLLGSRTLTVGQLTHNLVAFVLLGSGGAAGLLAILSVTGVLAAVMKDVPGEYLGKAFLLVPLGLLAGGLIAILRGLQRLRAAAVADATLGVATAGCTALALLVLHAGVGGAIIASALGTGLTVVATLVMLRGTGLSLMPRLRRNVCSRVLRFGLRGDLANISQFFSYRLDSFVLNFLAGASAVGIYTVATRLVELLWVLPAAVATVIFPRAAASAAQHLNATTPRILARTVAVVTAGAILMATVAAPIIDLLYGAAFAGAVVPLLLMLPGVVLLGGATVLTNELAGRGHPGFNSINSLAGLVVTLAGDFALIPAYGVAGAAIASSAAYAVNAVLALVFFLHVSKMGAGDLLHACRLR